MNKPTTRYFYDGQMACEEDFAEIVPNEDPFFEVTRYGLGARGIDWIEKATVEDTSISFTIYDGHGNVIAQLGRTGSSYSLTQVKKYDVWGGVRSGALGPAGRYCGNLGHVSDDESGLIYMRARYYEPGSGRFVSEDPARDGLNWFAYCGNDPVGRVDYSGESAISTFVWALAAVVGGAYGLIAPGIKRIAASTFGRTVLLAGAGMIVAWFFAGGPNGDGTGRGDAGDRTTDFAVCSGIISAILVCMSGINLIPEGHLGKEVACIIGAYSLVLAMFMALDQVAESVFELYGASQS